MVTVTRRTVSVQAQWTSQRLSTALGGRDRTRVILLLAGVLALSSADTATVGASATQLRAALHINNTDIGLLVAVTAAVAAVFSLPFGLLADRMRRTRLLSASVFLWGVAMLWSATVSSFEMLLVARSVLGLVTAAAGPVVASLIGDYFPASERGRIYGFVLTGELAGAGIGFAVTGDLAALSWRLAFVILALPTFLLARWMWGLREPVRGGLAPLLPEPALVAEAPGPPPATPRPGEDEHPATDALRLARDRGVRPDQARAEQLSQSLGLRDAIRLLFGVRTNTTLIIASAFGYFYLAGVETFGVEFVKEQYGINQAVANLLLLLLGLGSVAGVLAAGPLSDALLRRGRLNARVGLGALTATAAALLFLPGLISRSTTGALPYLFFAAFALAAQNPPIDAARLDIVPAALWGRAEGLRTALRTAAQALAPLVFGGLADLFGGGRAGLEVAFTVMLVPLAANGVMLFRAVRTYPGDVATAAAAAATVPGGPRRPR